MSISRSSYLSCVSHNSILGHICFGVVLDSFRGRDYAVKIGLKLLNLTHMRLKLGKSIQLLGTVFPTTSANNHAQDSACVVGQDIRLHLLVDRTFPRVGELPIFRLADLEEFIRNSPKEKSSLGINNR